MTKTQIQLPDELYKRAKAFAKTHEWSLAETLRRATEQFMDRYPTHPTTNPSDWQPPTPQALGWSDLSAQDLHDLALDDMEPRLPQ